MAVHVAIRYDLRRPDLSPASRRELYATCLDQAAYADEHGVDTLVLSEHHGVDDGYLPSPIPVAAAIAARTRRLPIIVAALLAPLYEPVRLAEDMVVTDLVSGSRVSYVLGLGYRREEYEQFGVPWADRGARMEACLRVLQLAWAGEPFEHEGRTVHVTPRPTTDRPPILYGGGSPAAARRAARFGLLFYPQNANPELAEAYHAERERLGNGHGYVITPPRQTGTFVLSDDPDRFWAEHGQHLLYEATVYRSWQVGLDSAVLDDSTTIDEMRAAGVYRVVTPDELVAEAAAGEIDTLTMHPLIGGLDPEVSWEGLRLLGEKVIPALRALD